MLPNITIFIIIVLVLCFSYLIGEALRYIEYNNLFKDIFTSITIGLPLISISCLAAYLIVNTLITP